ncbi:MAG: CDP-alcohol phosphatidyltransferase family protein [Intrasporangium sp.]|uniref:CDP-alcohol phosphatidyltransferase family protein n=1 Tax=Intrasporangium sp. TaxID=1925024 RepID=UPI0026486568|nr:CDP-alcohol phosphatidyltransferase family protein [Intrasporangium sp.]MDN5794473.1 CDP-alcohol phosphatidyltransferase family protein [Intrasporangium sp.]
MAPLVGDADARRVAVNRPAGESVLLGAHPDAEMCEALEQVGLIVAEARADEDPLTELAARAKARTDLALVVCAADLRVTPVALLDLVDTPADRTAALTIERAGLGSDASAMPPVRVASHSRQILSAGSAVHAVTRPTAYSAGVLRIRAADRPRVAEIWRVAGQTTVPAVRSIEPFDLALLALVRAGLPVQAVPIGPYTISRGSDHAPGAPGSPWQQRLRGASRGNDGAFSMAVVRPVSRRLTAVGLRAGWAPNIVTVVSLVLGLLACGLAATDTRGGWVAAAVLLQASLVVDCVDGEIARFTRTYSALGGWLDAVGDRVKEFAMVGVVAGVAAQRGTGLWTLAVVLLALLAIRHVEDYCYTRRARSAAADESPDVLPLTTLGDLGPADAPTTVPAPPRGRAVAVRKIKQVLHLPIAERYLIMSIGLLAYSPAFFLWALTVAVVLAFLWTGLGRTASALLRRDRLRTGGSDPHLAELLDLGPLAAPLGPVTLRLTGLRLGWQLPWLVLAAEAAVLLAALGHLRAGGQWAAYLWLAAICWHRYDLVYRLRETGRTPARWVGVLTLGAIGRIVLLLLAVAADWPLAAILAWGGVALFVLYAAEAAHDWTLAARSYRRGATEAPS